MCKADPTGWVGRSDQVTILESDQVTNLEEVDAILNSRLEFEPLLESVVEILVGRICHGCVLEVSGGDQDSRLTIVDHVDDGEATRLSKKVDALPTLMEAKIGGGVGRDRDIWKWTLGEELEDELAAYVDNLNIDSLMIAPLIGREESLGALILMTDNRMVPKIGGVEQRAIEGLVARITPIVESQYLRQQLARQSAHFKQMEAERALNLAVTQSLGEGTVAVDIDGRVTFANPAACRLLRYKNARELVGQNFHNLVHSPDRCSSENPCALWQGLGRMADIHSHDDEFIRGDDKVLPVAFTMTGLQGAGEHGGVIVFRDMSQYRHLQARLLLTDRMVAVGTLATGVAHEINNPLAYVQSNVCFVIGELQKRAEAKDSPDKLAEADADVLMEALVEGLEGIERIRTIVGGMKAFTEREDAVGIIDVEECLNDAIAVCHGESKQFAELHRQGENLAYVRGNAARLRQVFVNLLLNAVNAVRAGDAQGTIQVSVAVDGDRQTIEIADSGAGIDEADQKRIFDPFFTTNEVGGGTGLGLYVCRTIVNEIDGDISVESNPGEGATFVVDLPAIGASGEALI